MSEDDYSLCFTQVSHTFNNAPRFEDAPESLLSEVLLPSPLNPQTGLVHSLKGWHNFFFLPFKGFCLLDKSFYLAQWLGRGFAEQILLQRV